MATAQTSNRKKGRKRGLFKRKAFWFLLLLLSLVVVGLLGLMYFDVYTRKFRERANAYDLERINELELPSIILDRNGKEIGRIFVQNRSVVPIDKVPEIFKAALRAGEDQRFDSHGGVDFIGIARALYLNWKAGETTQGASTITQQLARNAYDLEGERRKYGESGMQRKIVEAFLARRIEKRYRKEQIMEFYLNRIYFGSGFYGIRSASLGYFGKEPKDLTALECAAIVGCVKNPTNLSPLNNMEANRKSRNLVLERMAGAGAIRRDEFRRLSAATLQLNPKPLRRGTSNLYERVADAVGRELGEDALAAGGFTIHTTILKEAQQAAERSLLQSLARAEAHPGYTRQKHDEYRKDSGKAPEYLQGAVLMVDHLTGEVLAYVGGRDYAEAPYDFIELGTRPPGTAFFPFIYAAALENGLTPATPVEDDHMDNRSVMVGGREGILGEWGMEVTSPQIEETITLRRALEASKIAATVRVVDQIGLQRVVDMAGKFGLNLKGAELLRRIAVGFEPVSLKHMVRAMASFPSGGRLGPADLVFVERVVAPNGSVRYRRDQSLPARPQVIDEATAWQVHSMLAGSLFRGSSKGALNDLVEKPFIGAGKGGSTHDFEDCWFLGYNARVTCGVWTGFLTGGGGPIYPGAFSRDLAMPVWQETINAATPYFGGGRLEPPPNVVVTKICAVSGQKWSPYCQEYREDSATGRVTSVSTEVEEYFRRGTEIHSICTLHTGGGEMIQPGDSILNLPALDAVPVRPTEPVLLGDDPYHTELPSFAAAPSQGGFMRRRTNVLDSLDLDEFEETIPLRRPQRLQIHDDD